MPSVIVAVEQQANNWGSKLSVAKLKVICFARCLKEMFIKFIWSQQVKIIRLLVLLYEEKLTWKQYIN